MRYLFKSVCSDSDSLRVQVSFEADDLQTVLEYFQNFLAASGFYVPENMHLDWVKDE